MPIRRWLASLVCLMACIGMSAAFAQTPTPPEPEAKGPSVIAVADIPLRADADERFAEEVIIRAGSPDPIAPLVPRLDAIEKSVDEKARQIRFDELRTLPVLRLESLERHWRFDARLLARWQDDMRDVGAPNVQDAAEIARRRVDWEATQAAPGFRAMPAALGARVEALVLQLKQAEQALSAPLARQIEVGRRANAIDARIQAGTKAVAGAIDYIDRRLVRIDAPPLWRIAGAGQADQGAAASIKAGMNIETRFLRDYAAANTGNQRALNVFQLLLLPVLIWLGIRSRRSSSPMQQNDASARVMRRPFSSWLLLSMMGVLVFEPDAPLLLHQFAMLVALVPVLRLLPPESARLLGPWPYVATGLYLLERIGLVFMANSFLYRSYHLGLTLLALLLMLWLLWLLWRSRHVWYAGAGGRIGKWVHVAAWISVVLLAVSALSNLLGNVSLAEMLTSGVIDSGYFALALHAAMTVFLALLNLLFERRHGAPFRFGRGNKAAALRSIERVLAIGAMVGWAVFAMNHFRIFRPTYELAESVLKHSFEVGEISVSLGHVLVFAVSVLVAFWAAKTVRFLLQEQLLTKMSLPRGVGNSVASLTYYALLLLGVVVALSAAGFKISQLAFVFGALGVGIGFGLQGVVNNFVSGLILMFERPIQPGDVIDIGGTSGRVREIGMRATTITTFEGADVVVPNGTLLSEQLTNWTLLDRNRRLDVDLGVGYGSDPARIIELLAQAASQTPGVSKEPAPSALFMGFGASSLDFAVRAWTSDYDNWVNIRSDLMTRIHALLADAGIEIPFPQQDLHLRSISPEARAALAPRAADEGSAKE